MQSLPQMELILETPLYITRTYGLNMTISTFFSPWNMVSLEDVFQK